MGNIWQELEVRGGGQLGQAAERLRRAGANGKRKQNLERDYMRTIVGGVLDMATQFGSR